MFRLVKFIFFTIFLVFFFFGGGEGINGKIDQKGVKQHRVISSDFDMLKVTLK